jgi:alkylated DNA repair protein (DNA oxidative demethylase)
VLDIWRAVASYPHLPEACLVNFYDCDARTELHQDKDEALAAPVVSISLGDSCSFRFGGLRRAEPAKKLELHSEDIVVMGGPARLIFQGVDRIYPGTSDLLPGGGRINLTLRRVRRPDLSVSDWPFRQPVTIASRWRRGMPASTPREGSNS